MSGLIVNQIAPKTKASEATPILAPKFPEGFKAMLMRNQALMPKKIAAAISKTAASMCVHKESLTDTSMFHVP